MSKGKTWALTKENIIVRNVINLRNVLNETFLAKNKFFTFRRITNHTIVLRPN